MSRYLKYLKYLKNMAFPVQKNSVITIVGTTGVGKSKVRLANIILTHVATTA